VRHQKRKGPAGLAKNSGALAPFPDEIYQGCHCDNPSVCRSSTVFPASIKAPHIVRAVGPPNRQQPLLPGAGRLASKYTGASIFKSSSDMKASNLIFTYTPRKLQMARHVTGRAILFTKDRKQPAPG
jgi:hypothetical protein